MFGYITPMISERVLNELLSNTAASLERGYPLHEAWRTGMRASRGLWGFEREEALEIQELLEAGNGIGSAVRGHVPEHVHQTLLTADVTGNMAGTMKACSSDFTERRAISSAGRERGALLNDNGWFIVGGIILASLVIFIAVTKFTGTGRIRTETPAVFVPS